MNASVREPDNGSSKDEPLKYAPKKARQSQPGPPPAGDPPPNGDSASARALPEHPAPASSSAEPPPWRRSRPRNSGGGGGTAFVGDVAIAELRTKLALAPDRLPEPPPAAASGSKLMWAGRLTGVAVVVAVGLLGYRWGSSPNVRLQLPLPSSHRPPAPQDRAATSQNPGGAPVGGLTVINAVPAVYPPPAKASPPGSGRTFRPLMVGPVPVQQTDEAARLTISAPDAGPNAAVVISGLAPGSTLSAGREAGPNTWRVSVEELPGVSVTPPRAFAGSMDLIVELRLADNSVADRKGLQLEWLGRGIAARPQPRQHDAAEIAQMIKKGAELMANGDVAAARLMYQRAAEAGEATAAFALAESYDPLLLATGGIPPDVGLAQTWYAKARDMGSPQAPERLDRLAHPPEP
jgi:hypothetical protein